MKEINLERIKEINEDLYSDIIQLDKMFHRYVTLLTRIDETITPHIKSDEIISLFFEEENKYEFEDDGNTYTEGIEVSCCWILPVCGNENSKIGDEFKYFNGVKPFVRGIPLKNDENGYVLLTYNAYIRTSDHRYRRCFTSLYYRRPELSVNGMDAVTRITFINDNYDKDHIFFDLKSLAELHQAISDDYKKVDKLLKIEKLAMAEDINLYVKRY